MSVNPERVAESLDEVDGLIKSVARAIYLADALSDEEDARKWDAHEVDEAERNAYLSMAKAAIGAMRL